MMGFMAKSASETQGRRSWFIVHRDELVQQASQKLTDVGVKHGFIKPGEPLTDDLVQIAMVQSIKSRLPKIKELGYLPNNIIVDECHHSLALSYKQLWEQFPAAYFIGLSATPERLDGKGLDELFDEIVCGPTMAWLIENGFLSPYQMYVPPGNFHLKKSRTTAGDYNLGDMDAEIQSMTSLDDCIYAHYDKYLSGKRVLGFTGKVRHALRLAEVFNDHGVPAACVHGAMKKNERKALLQMFANDQIKAIFSAELIGEGFDVPACGGAILARPTKSTVLYLQQCGRALRRDPNDPDKVAIILDFANNSETHGLPSQERKWSLEGRKKRLKDEKESGMSVPVKTCPKCYIVVPAAAKTCWNCEHTFTTELGDKEKKKHIELQALDQEFAKRQEDLQSKYNNCTTYAHFMSLAKNLGYKSGWAWIQAACVKAEINSHLYVGKMLNAAELHQASGFNRDSVDKFLSWATKRGLYSEESTIGTRYPGDKALSRLSGFYKHRGVLGGKKTHRDSKLNSIKNDSEKS